MDENGAMEVQENVSVEEIVPAVEPAPVTESADGGNGQTERPSPLDVILPDGWTGESPYPITADDPLGLGPEPDGRSASDGGEAPETLKADAETKPSDAGGKAESAPDTPESTEAEPDYKALYEQEMTRQREARERETFRQTYRAQIEAGLTPEAARAVAAYASGGKEYPLEDASGAAGQESGQGVGGDRQMSIEISQLRALYPDAKEIPPEVTRDYMSGKGSLASLYAGYQMKQSAAEIERLRNENATLRQNAANRDRAVVTGVSGNGMKRDSQDDMVKAFMDELMR